MSSHLTTERTTTAFDVLAAPHRRYLLSILYERRHSSDSTPSPQSRAIAIETLATEIAVREHGSPIVTEDQSRDIQIRLLHHHVPRLLDVGLVTEHTGGDARALALADHPILESEGVTTLLENPTGEAVSTETELNRTLEALQPARCRLACDILSRRDGDLAVTDLAVMIAARENDCRLVDVTETEWKPITTTLVHNHVPALADAGLVEYDRSTESVAITADAPQWQADWLAASPLGALATDLETPQKRARTGAAGLGSDAATETDPTGAGVCWTIEGSENVVARGHEIADTADEELFVTLPDAGLIQQRCLERWRAAADRGVDVYIGSRSPRVRDTVRSAVPDATICELRSDWLNFPVERIHHGRVVFADRETVMLVTVDDADGDPRATAITGDGAGNTLVKLVRELVGPRIDRLESASNDGDSPDERATLL
ncbi:DUF7344 domain-containing protein [Natronorubrum halophilum]|uniref:DUF7344 domain-containing protein n=1 Tax=Natronorubrum halophilum TaxID=1702106 RepID=UPI0010C1CBCC|nr:hypothetical protein [Natronorubrum halophilum]